MEKGEEEIMPKYGSKKMKDYMKKQGRETFRSKDGSIFVEKKPGPKDVGKKGPGMFFHVKIRDPSKSKLPKGSGKWEKKK